ncbi:MAG: TMEM175 family protein [Fluviicoccus sp.]|uniref:TMEM175 family protein n=1 Tax=Fluviicoccus sp. TaxID=2003552 RepID=UPI0027249029|nr:TMEM175 family protein [Fluviicoccus sp.]MDO8331956.1 TMEM175 family protein [Fluviicoccus sp.]
MHKNRLEAFTDGVLAIVITIMVLEIKVPHGETLDVLLPLWPKFISYALSFLYVGIYWNNHHHTMQAVKSVNGGILWSNLHLLFWLSLLPFSTGWMGENHFATMPTVLYGVNLLLCALAYYLWTRSLVWHHGPDSALAEAFGRDLKGKMSLGLYALGIGLSLWNSSAGFAVFTGVALMWLVPDRRMHKALAQG